MKVCWWGGGLWMGGGMLTKSSLSSGSETNFTGAGGKGDLGIGVGERREGSSGR